MHLSDSPSELQVRCESHMPCVCFWAGRRDVHSSAPERLARLYELSKLLQQQQVRDGEIQHCKTQAQ